MPIRFRCGYCTRLLGIARRKAGTHTSCPHCGAIIAVPPAEEFDNADEGGAGLGEIDQLLKADRAAGGGGSPAAVAEPRVNEGFSTTPSDVRVEATPPPAVPQPSVRPPAPKPAPPAPEAAAPPAPAPQVAPPNQPDTFSLTEAEQKPLFERDVDAMLGNKPDAPRKKKRKTPAAADPEPMSLDPEPRGVVLSASAMTGLVIAGLVVIILAFTGGYFVGSR